MTDKPQQICIYCGKKIATEKDHIPPRNLFPKPRPDNLITVPSCSGCNREYGKDDERVRNLITSLYDTESHPAIIDQIGPKRGRSFQRPEGITNLRHFLKSLKPVEAYTKGGIYIGDSVAIDMDQPVMNRFFERMVRGLLYHTNEIEYFEGVFKWRLTLSPEEIQSLPDEIKQMILHGVRGYLGDNIFSYIGVVYPGKAKSLWFMNFYGGIEFMVHAKENR